jgi:hypothetical protein
MVGALGRPAGVVDWAHSSDRGFLDRIGCPNTFGSTRSRRNTVAAVDYAAVDSALPSLGVLPKGVDFHAVADHLRMKLNS